MLSGTAGDALTLAMTGSQAGHGAISVTASAERYQGANWLRSELQFFSGRCLLYGSSAAAPPRAGPVKSQAAVVCRCQTTGARIDQREETTSSSDRKRRGTAALRHAGEGGAIKAHQIFICHKAPSIWPGPTQRCCQVVGRRLLTATITVMTS